MLAMPSCVYVAFVISQCNCFRCISNKPEVPASNIDSVIIDTAPNPSTIQRTTSITASPGKENRPRRLSSRYQLTKEPNGNQFNMHYKLVSRSISREEQGRTGVRRLRSTASDGGYVMMDLDQYEVHGGDDVFPEQLNERSDGVLLPVTVNNAGRQSSNLLQV